MTAKTFDTAGFVAAARRSGKFSEEEILAAVRARDGGAGAAPAAPRRELPRAAPPTKLSGRAVREIEQWWIGHGDQAPEDVIGRFERAHKGWSPEALRYAVNTLGESPRIRVVRRQA
ncbi:MAG TPA: hypothetical protein VMY87_08955, partial [Armatimonadota bacterium]|nr:hypothetical protein [Armatimonadota bacterium]